MSSHGTIEAHGFLYGLADPDVIEDEGVRIEINVPEFLWADDEAEAIAFLDKVISNAQAGKRKLRAAKKAKKEAA
jgi:hypothetical protein